MPLTEIHSGRLLDGNDNKEVHRVSDTDIYERVNKYDQIKKCENIKGQSTGDQVVSPYEPVGDDRSPIDQHHNKEPISQYEPVPKYDRVKNHNEVSPYESVNDDDEVPQYKPATLADGGLYDNIEGCKGTLSQNNGAEATTDYEPVEKYRPKQRNCDIDADEKQSLLVQDNNTTASNEYEPVEKYRVKKSEPTSPPQYNPYDVPISEAPEEKDFGDLYAKVDKSKKKSNR